MTRPIPLFLFAATLLLASCKGSNGNGDGNTTSGDDDDDDTVHGPTVTVQPTVIDSVLTNPNMGLANFHFGWWCNLPPVDFSPTECADRTRENWPTNHPDAGTAYFRWHWRDLEPTRGNIDFDMIDAALQSANALDETLGFRVMVIAEGSNGLPDWLLDPPYSIDGDWLPSSSGPTFWPEVRDDTYQAEHQRFLAALGERYNDHPAVDHVDIGTAGCWGEWNTACLDGVGSFIDAHSPGDAGERAAVVSGYRELVDAHVSAFPDTPLVMLGIGEGGDEELDIMLHATGQGAGWRVDCWGDWGIWGPGWNHHENLYPQMIDSATAADPAFADVWQHAPIQLEVCSTMPAWEGLGWTADTADSEVSKTFQFALDQHASLLNGKFTDIPASYTSALDDLLRQNGYRIVLSSLTHDESVAPGGALTLESSWENAGVAPMYSKRVLSWRLRSDSAVVELASDADPRTWLPGSTEVVDSLVVPADTAPGDWVLDVALLDRPGVDPATEPLPPLQLAVDGRGSDGWYALSDVEVKP